ncbi:MAG: DUF2169 domain-containing protein, partial [Thermodesulfobacteriota bacterium]
MNIAKALHPGLLYKTFSYGGKSLFTVSLLWGFRLDSGEPVLEQKLWTSIAAMMGKNEMFDAGMPKANAEVLAHGSFFSSTGRPVGGGKVCISIGPLRKELAVFGDRRWAKALGMVHNIIGPAPITQMPVTYAHAFGGQGFDKNPIGQGYAPVETEEGPIHPLPNIEYPDRLIGSPDDRPEPAGLGRVDLMWKQRLSKAGTYDEKYIQERLPGLPDDIDWTYFNDGAPDQWLEGFFQGDESFQITNMNPENSVLRGRLPGVYGRCFVNQEKDGRIVFQEIKTRLDTVWFFPADNLGVLIHRGSLEVSEDDGADIKQILIAHENLADPPRSLEHYQIEMKVRTDPETAGFALLDTAPLIPEGYRCGFKAMLEDSDHPVEGLASRNVLAFADEKVKQARAQMEEKKAEAAAQLEKAGLDPQEHLGKFDHPEPEELPETKQITEILEKAIPGVISNPDHIDISKIKLKELDKLKEVTDRLVAEKKEQADSELRRQLEEMKTVEDRSPEMEESIRQVEKALAGPEPQPLPRINEEEIIASVRRQFAELETQAHLLLSLGLPQEQVASKLDVDKEDVEQKLKQALAGARDGYRQGAHAIEKALSPHPGREEEIAAALLEAHRTGGKTAGGDYAFVNLSGRDLSGIDLSGSYLEFADLSGADLTGANLEKAILARADLTGANFTNARLREANLGGAEIKEADFIDADLTGAILSQARIRNSRFHGCKLVDRPDMFIGTVFENTDFSGSVMTNNNFLDLDFSGCRFEWTDLSGSHFLNPKMHQAVFDRAVLQGVNFIAAQGEKASFRDADMKNARFLAGCLLAGADF